MAKVELLKNHNVYHKGDVISTTKEQADYWERVGVAKRASKSDDGDAKKKAESEAKAKAEADEKAKKEKEEKEAAEKKTKEEKGAQDMTTKNLK